MSLYDYQQSLYISSGQQLHAEPTFAALIMAALRKADSDNVTRIRTAWPDTYREFVRRRDARGGLLPEDPEANAAAGGS